MHIRLGFVIIGLFFLFSCNTSKSKDDLVFENDKSQNILLGRLYTKEDSASTQGKLKSKEDPFYNSWVILNCDESKANFSTDFYNYTVNFVREEGIDITTFIRENEYSFDTQSLFCTSEYQQNGILGFDCRRIRVHVSEAEWKMIGYVQCFDLKGKTNTVGNICDFEGRITIDGIYRYKNSDLENEGLMFGHYGLQEDSKQKGSGVFSGTFVCHIIIDNQAKVISLDDRYDVADGYENKNYVGVWKSNNGKTIKKCIWGDYRLPYSFDFDIGDGEMRVNKKYVKNGWESYNDGSEYECDDKTHECKLKDQWWKNEN